jgi:hypothetical protein
MINLSSISDLTKGKRGCADERERKCRPDSALVLIPEIVVWTRRQGAEIFKKLVSEFIVEHVRKTGAFFI